MGGIGQNILREMKEDGNKTKSPKISKLLDAVCKQLKIKRVKTTKHEKINIG